VIAYANPRIRNLEHEIPDAIPDDEPEAPETAENQMEPASTPTD